MTFSRVVKTLRLDLLIWVGTANDTSLASLNCSSRLRGQDSHICLWWLLGSNNESGRVQCLELVWQDLVSQLTQPVNSCCAQLCSIVLGGACYLYLHLKCS